MSNGEIGEKRVGRFAHGKGRFTPLRRCRKEGQRARLLVGPYASGLIILNDVTRIGGEDLIKQNDAFVNS
jgi:hypothetical protein